LVDLRVVFLATRILLSFVVLPNAVFELRKYAYAPVRSCAAVHGAHPVSYAQAGNLLRLQARQWPCRFADARPLMPE
jgi:hypothetical protein